jgi:hypothetical protein
MKKLALLSILAALISSVAFFTRAQAFSPKGNPLTAPRYDSDEAFACSNETLEGTYGLNISGMRPVPTMPGTIEQLIGVGTRTFDGNGNFSQVTNEKGSVTGLPLPNRALQGTYFVNPDCSGTLTLNIPGLPFSIVYDIVVVSHGREFQSIVASPQPVMVSTTGQRIR